MRQKKRDLINLLLKHKGEFVTSGSLAAELSLSDRTIRQYIRDFKETLEKNGAQIDSKPGHGFRLVIMNQRAFSLFLSSNQLQNSAIEPIKFVDATDRKKFLLNKLLLESERINLEELADQMFISFSQLSKDMSELKRLLADYHLTLQKNKQGVVVDGEEREKRHFIMDYFFGHENTTFLQNFIGVKGLADDISFQELTLIILDECREAELRLSDLIIQNLVLHLALSIKRMKSGLEIKNLGLDEEVTRGAEYTVAAKIIERIEPLAQVTFPHEELEYLTLHLMAKSTNIRHAANPQLEAHLQARLIILQAQLGYPLSEDYQLIQWLLDHIRPMLVRLAKNIKQENPLLDEIMTRYLFVFQSVKKTFSEMEEFRVYEISDDEWAYLTLHVLTAIEKYRDQRKMRILIICATGYGSAQLLKARVIKEFGKHITVTDVRGYYEINQQSLVDIDMILSSIDLSKMIFKMPVLHVSVFLNDSDIKLIRKKIEDFSSSQPNEVDYSDRSSINMQAFLTSDYFLSYEVDVSKEQVIEELLLRLSLDEESDYVEKMTQQIAQRERLGQIVFSETIAVPHPAIPMGRIPKIGVARIPNGLFWNEQYPKIQFVFLISPSMYDNEELPKATKEIVELIDSPDVQRELLLVDNFQHFLDVFKKVNHGGGE